jgi:hypothetical protein
MFGVNSKSYPASINTICHAQTFIHEKEYVQKICALVPSTHVAPSDKTTRVFHLLHPFAKVDLPPFVDDFHLEMEVTLDRMEFIFALVCPPCFSFDGPSSMVYEFL